MDPSLGGVLVVVSATAILFAVLYARSESRRMKGLRSARRQATTHRVSDALTRPSEVDEVLQSLFQQAQEALRSDVVLVGLVDEASNQIVGFASCGTEQSWRDFRMAVGHPTSAAASAVRSGQVIALSDVSASRFRDGPVISKMKLESCAFAPMMHRGDPVGVLVFGFRSARRFQTVDIQLMETFAADAAVGIGRGRHLEALKDLHRQKDEFISMVSHELRNPLTAIKGYGEMLRKPTTGPLNPTQHEYLDILLRASDRLFALIEDLMTVSRAEAGLLPIEKVPIDFTEVMGSVVTTMQPKVQTKHLKLLCLPSGNQVVEADRKRMEQVLTNLVDNAIKFSPEQGTVRLKSHPKDAGLWVQVSDEGVGIPPEEQDRLFEKFFRATTAERVDTPGTGLGLAISKAIVESHGGYIGADSQPERGSDFYFWIPGTS